MLKIFNWKYPAQLPFRIVDTFPQLVEYPKIPGLIDTIKYTTAQQKHPTNGKKASQYFFVVLFDKNKTIIKVFPKIPYFSEFNFLLSHS